MKGIIRSNRENAVGRREMRLRAALLFGEEAGARDVYQPRLRVDRRRSSYTRQMVSSVMLYAARIQGRIA